MKLEIIQLESIRFKTIFFNLWYFHAKYFFTMNPPRAPSKKPPPLMDTATERNPKTLRLLKPNGLFGRSRAIATINTLDIVPLTPPTRI
jgi:hypothetical protein